MTITLIKTPRMGQTLPPASTLFCMHRVAGVLLVVALVAAACGGGGKHASAKSAAATGNGTAGSTTTSSVVVAGAASSTTAPGAKNASGTGKGATAPAGSSATTATTAKSGSTSTAKGPQPAAPGTYAYDRTGTSHNSISGDQSADGKVSLQVDPVGSGRQHSVQKSPNSTREQTVEFLAEGAYFTDLKQSIGNYTKEFTPNPPVLAMAADASAGRTWSWTVTSTDGKTTLTSSFKVERDETITVGGESVPTVVLTVVLKATGDVVLNDTSTNWVSPAKGLIVRTDDTSDGSFSGITFHSQTSMILESTRPS